jgi:hypothetical protein
MVKMIDLIEEFCEYRAYSCERLDGRVSGNDRQKAIDRYIYNYVSYICIDYWVYWYEYVCRYVCTYVCLYMSLSYVCTCTFF